MSAAEEAWRKLMGVYADDPLLRSEKANYVAGYRRAEIDTIDALIERWPVITRDMVSRGYVRDWLKDRRVALNEAQR